MGAGSVSDPAKLRDFIDREARRLGFDAVRVTTPDAAPQARDRLARAVAAGHHGTMQWMAETLERRGDPATLWPQTRSIVMLAMNYGPDTDPLDLLARKDRAAISVYARNRDYHDIIKGRLKELAGKLAARSGADVKVWTESSDEARAATERGLSAFGGPIDPNDESPGSPLEGVTAFAVISDDDSLNPLDIS